MYFVRVKCVVLLSCFVDYIHIFLHSSEGDSARVIVRTGELHVFKWYQV